ncbi:MAG: low molecular weight protein-tyrosine-phosphatase, partial [Bacteroidales bacterium]|nr:low molecular weight protein-tyrosine-phosphatase [Bacteroidales bacterium]
MKKILFVCHGNICRSVMAEMVMKHIVRKANREGEFLIDSCATSTEEIGNDIYPPAKQCLTAHNIPFTHHQARQIVLEDYQRFDLIILMDHNNLRNIKRIIPSDTDKKIRMLLTHDVADPWYTGDFEATYRDVVAGC